AATPVLLPVAIRGPARAPVAARREVESDRREAHPVDRRADGGVAGGAGGAAVDILNVARLQSPRIAEAARGPHVRASVMNTRRWCIATLALVAACSEPTRTPTDPGPTPQVPDQADRV